MSNPPQPPAKDAPKPTKVENTTPHEQESVAEVVKEKIQRGEMSEAEARRLFEDLNKARDA